MKRLPLIAIWIILGSIILDQVSKYWIFARFNSYHTNELIPGFMNITLSMNTGVAFGMGQDKNLFFTIFTSAVIFLLVYFHHHFTTDKPATIGYSLIIGGAIGNLIDRITHNGVRDFIDVYYQEHSWPIFNVADSCITVGVGLLLIWSLKQERETKKTNGQKNLTADAE